MERENNFYVRLDLQVKVEGGKEVLGMVNDFLNSPEIGAGRVTLVGVSMVSETSRAVSLLDLSTQDPLLLVDQEGKGAVFRHLTESVKSGSGFVMGMDTPVKLVRSLPGLTKENLYYWEKKGYIHPEMVQRGAKKSRIFPTSEAFRVAYIWKFLREGFTLPTAVKMAEQELLKIKESQPTLSGARGSGESLLERKQPLFIEVANSLRDKITSGDYSINAQLPSEKDMEKEYNVSRGTIREAVRILAQKGFVFKMQGKGIFVAKIVGEHPQNKD